MATRELRHANFIFASNALNATSTSLVSGATPVSTVTLTWTDNLGWQHTAVYGVSGNSLSRTLDGVSTTLSARVFSGAFSLSGKLLTFDLQLVGKPGNTKSMSLGTYLRRLP